jgi:polysaccharide biosynthesis/export protein ExoF
MIKPCGASFKRVLSARMAGTWTHGACGLTGSGCFRVALLAVMFGIASLTAMPVHAEGYRLSSYDKLNIRVVEWRQGEAEYKDWEFLTGVYPIVGGRISVPIAGELVAEGKTTAELAKEMAEILQKETGLLKAPSVSVNIESHGPIYVMGDVQEPGEFVYSPNMTVLQAISRAGGFFRKADASFMRFDRDRIASTGDLEAAEADNKRLLIRQARLEAELKAEHDFEIPAELRDNPTAASIAEEERKFMNARTSMLKSKLDTSKDLQRLSEQETATLEEKIKSQHVQIQLTKDELEGVTSLYKKGLSVTSRQMTLQRQLADAESKLLDFEVALVQSKQSQKQAERDAEDLRSTTIAEIQKELQEVMPKLEHAKVEMRTSAMLIREATVTAPALLAAREKEQIMQPVFSLVREVNGESQQITAAPNTRLEPNDVLEVTLEEQAAEEPAVPPGN